MKTLFTFSLCLLSACSTVNRSSKPDLRAGSLVHFSLPTKDIQSSIHFYRALFGWNFKKMTETYWLVEDGLGSLSLEGASKGGSMPILYFRVMNIESTLKVAEQLGATVLINKTSAGDGRSYYATIRDLNGTTIGLWSLQ